MCWIRTFSLALFIGSSCCDFVVNVRTRDGNVVKQTIKEHPHDSFITLEYDDWDLTKVTQVIDYQSGFSIYRIVLYGEIDAGQPLIQTLCFLNHLSHADFIEPDSVGKLRQKNQSAIRISENHLGVILSDVNLSINLDDSDVISPHIKTYCEGTNGAIYSTREDFTKTAQVYSRDYDQLISATERISSDQLPRCHLTKSKLQACSCHYQFSIDWYPCSLRYCKGADDANSAPQYYKCGIKTCGVTRLYQFAVDSNSKCWWEWYTTFD